MSSAAFVEFSNPLHGSYFERLWKSLPSKKSQPRHSLPAYISQIHVCIYLNAFMSAPRYTTKEVEQKVKGLMKSIGWFISSTVGKQNLIYEIAAGRSYDCENVEVIRHMPSFVGTDFLFYTMICIWARMNVCNSSWSSVIRGILNYCWHFKLTPYTGPQFNIFAFFCFIVVNDGWKYVGNL